MTHELEPIPASLFDAGGLPRWGSYRGAFDRVDLDPIATRLDRLVRRKRWMWMTAVSGEVLVAACVVDLGYVANAFAFVADDSGMIVDRSVLAPRAHIDGSGRARLDARKLRIALGPERISADASDLAIDVVLDASTAPPAITAVARTGKVNVTQKRALASVRGTVRAAGRTFSLDGGLGGWDFTSGLLARHTAWKWAFGVGRDRSGTPIAFNLVEGFVGAAECALFRPNATSGLDEARFRFDRDHVEKPWHVESEGVDLHFRPAGVHAQHTNFGIVRSRFIQAAGEWSGTIGGTAIDRVRGVAEDQDVLW